MDTLLFLYPIEPYVRHELRNGAGFLQDNPERDAWWWERLASASPKEFDHLCEELIAERMPLYRLIYSETLNACIRARYRTRGCRVAFAVFSDTPVSDVIDRAPEDAIIDVGMTFTRHTTPLIAPDGAKWYRYPSSDRIVDAVADADRLYVTGFHATDCVLRVLGAALGRGIDAIIDEDLTHFFRTKMCREDFRVDAVPQENPPWALKLLSSPMLSYTATRSSSCTSTTPRV